MTVPGPMNSADRAYVLRTTPHGMNGATTNKSADAVLVQLPPRVPRGLPPQVLQHVREYVDAHLESDISVEALTGISGLSISRFARAFEQSEGMTPHEYVTQRRIQRARELLAGTEMSVAAIARATGFSDQSHLTRQFQEHVGTTPSNYRWLIR